MVQPNFEPRITSLESSVKNLTDDISNVIRSVDKYADRTQTQIESLTNKMGESQKPQWGLLASWAGIILTIISMLGYIITKDNNETETTANKALELIIEHVVNTHEAGDIPFQF